MDFAIRRVEHVIEARMDPVLEIAEADFRVAERKAKNERLRVSSAVTLVQNEKKPEQLCCCS